MSRILRKAAFCICENKDADQLHGNREADQRQLRGNREADQRLCFCYTDSTISLLRKYEISSLQPSSVDAAWFVWGLVGNPEDRFCQSSYEPCFEKTDF